MNPNNKLINPIPSKQNKKGDPYERIQSCPPDGKEQDKNRDLNMKEAFKNCQTNAPPKVKPNNNV